MSNTPSDEELQALWEESDHPLPQNFARAVLAKWGTHQPVNLGFTIETRAGADVLVWKEGGCRPATSAEVAMWKALSAVQQPVVREPLTEGLIVAAANEAFGTTEDLDDETLVNKYGHGVYISRFIDFARAIEAEVRKQDEALIQQLVEALDDLTEAGEEAWSEERPCVRIGKEAITAGRARLGEKT